MKNRASVRVLLSSVTAVVAGLLVFSPRADAQITVPGTTLPAAGDTLKLAVDSSPDPCAIFLSFTPPGGPQTWDFSNCLQADTTREVVYRPANEGSVTVPGATMFAVVPRSSPVFPASPSTEEYYDVSGGALRLLATYGTANPIIAFNSVFRFVPPLPERYTPLNFFDIRQNSANVLTAYDASAIPVIQAIVPTADSVRVRATYQQISVVDAFGTVIIPGGSYEVLRQKSTTYQSVAVDVKVAPLGWIDVSTIGGQQLLPLGTDTITHFSYYNDVAKEPIAVLRLNTAQNAVLQATFKDVTPVCANDGDPCGDPSSSACDLPDTCLAGVCVPNLRPNGTACSDGNACTTGDSCQAGACVGGPPPNCNDGNACTSDSCNPATGCVSVLDPVCVPPISVIAAVQQTESCAPANGVVDPDERVTYAITLRNNGSQPTTNLVATLLASAGVSAPSGAQKFGVIPAGASATRSFSWTGVGACGAAWSAVLALADNGQAVPSVAIAGTYGTPDGVCNTGCAVVRIATKTALRRNDDGSVRARVTVTNTGSVQANNVVLTGALLGTSSGTPSPRGVAKVLPAGQSETVTVTFPSTVLAGASVLRLNGTYTGGTFSSSLRVTVP